MQRPVFHVVVDSEFHPHPRNQIKLRTQDRERVGVPRLPLDELLMEHQQDLLASLLCITGGTDKPNAIIGLCNTLLGIGYEQGLKAAKANK